MPFGRSCFWDGGYGSERFGLRITAAHSSVISVFQNWRVRSEWGTQLGKVTRGHAETGFSLIELLIVVAIILIIAAIAIPNLLRARIAANESSSVASIRTLNTAEISYNSAYPTVGFASTLGALSGTSCSPPTSAGACLIDTQLSTGTKSGYHFTLGGASGTPNSTYQIAGSPLAPNQTGVRSFCSVADAVVRYSSAALTSCAGTESPLQ